VESAVLSLDALHRDGNTLLVCDIGGYGQGARTTTANILQRRVVDVEQGDPHAFGQEPFSDGETIA
jgi:hypothetical protein